MENEYKKLELYYLKSTFIDDFSNYIKSRNDYAQIINIYNIVKNEAGFNKQDLTITKRIYDEYFNLNKVLYYSKRMPILKYFRDKKIKEIEMISPFDIPINFTNNDIISCCVDGGIIPYKNNNIRYVKMITLSKVKLILEFYAHEIAHTQQVNCSGVNNEIIPIFMELLAANYYNRENIIIFFRINNILNNLEFIKHTIFPHDELLVVQKNDSIKYTESALKALMLHFIFTHEQLSSKKFQIIDDIQENFNNTLSIEKLLDKYDIKEDNYKNLSLIKSYFK